MVTLNVFQRVEKYRLDLYLVREDYCVGYYDGNTQKVLDREYIYIDYYQCYTDVDTNF